jgi:hypothetical protein
MTPIRLMPGSCTAWISPARSRRLALLPALVEHGRQQDVLAAGQGIGIDAEQSEQAGDRALQAVDARVSASSRSDAGGAVKEPSTEIGRPRGAARRVDGEIRRLAQPGDALRALFPVGEALAPDLGLCGGECATTGRQSLRPGASTQGSKSLPRSSGKVSSRLPMSPLGSMAMTGIWSIAASSIRSMPRPVLPLPVMPMITACVVRSFES